MISHQKGRSDGGPWQLHRLCYGRPVCEAQAGCYDFLNRAACSCRQTQASASNIATAAALAQAVERGAGSAQGQDNAQQEQRHP